MFVHIVCTRLNFFHSTTSAKIRVIFTFAEDGRHPLPSHTHSIDRERGWRNMQYNGNQHTADDEDDTAGDGRAEGSDGEPMIGEGGVASDDQQDGDDGDEDI
jgi:hypothetical protein